MMMIAMNFKGRNHDDDYDGDNVRGVVVMILIANLYSFILIIRILIVTSKIIITSIIIITTIITSIITSIIKGPMLDENSVLFRQYSELPQCVLQPAI